MPRAALTVKQVERTTGLTPAYEAAQAPGSGSNYFANDGRTFLHIKNGGGAPITATFQTPGDVNGLAIADLVITVNNATEKMVGPLEPSIFNQADGTVYVDWSAVTTVTVMATRL